MLEVIPYVIMFLLGSKIKISMEMVSLIILMSQSLKLSANFLGVIFYWINLWMI